MGHSAVIVYMGHVIPYDALSDECVIGSYGGKGGCI